MSNQNNNFLGLFKEKKYSTIISIIESKLSENQRTSGLLNLKGVCRMMISDSSESIKLAVEDFRKSYYKETDKSKLVEPIKNLINASVILFETEFIKNERFLDNDFFDEINTIYKENKDLFENNLHLIKAISKVYKRTVDVKNVIKCLERIIKLDSNRTAIQDTVAAYNYYNNYRNDWAQSDFLVNSKKINDILVKYPSKDLINLKTKKNKRINIGFISSDIKSKHSVTYFLRSVISVYDKEKFIIHLYHNHNKNDDEITKEFERYVFKTIHINKLSDKEVINIIRKDEIDIIIDLNGFSGNHRLNLFKNRLAPIQILWCGYTNTTGLNEMDYLIVDRNQVNPEEESLYSEKMIYLPNIWNCHSGYDFKRSENEMPLKKNKFITFGSFNNFLKVNDEVIEVWASILKKVENSRLFLKTSAAISKGTFKKKFEKYGVLDSVYFLNYSKNFNDHLEKYKLIDIALDTFPWNGVTTTFESIWMNVPVIVMHGSNFNSRCGSSIIKNLNLRNLIANNKEDYINNAVTLAQNQQMLMDLRKELFKNALKTPLFDKTSFSNEFFSSLEKIYN
tara:strand:- start:289 stop:1986 length:1698 start_codon:yes stop_codon:yes gene_type:complete